MSWKKLNCQPHDLQLLATLSGGQSFRWTHNTETDEWTGIFSKTIWKLKQGDNCLLYQVLGSLLNFPENNGSNNKKTNFKKLLENYLRLDYDLKELYKDWSNKDELFKSAGQQFYGVRMLRQEPVENLFSFICSQNNHISRISSMVEKLCTNYGEEIC